VDLSRTWRAAAICARRRSSLVSPWNRNSPTRLPPISQFSPRHVSRLAYFLHATNCRTTMVPGFSYEPCFSLRYCSVTVPLLLRYCSATVPLLFRYCSAIIPLLLRHYSAIVSLLFRYCSSRSRQRGTTKVVLWSEYTNSSNVYKGILVSWKSETGAILCIVSLFSATDGSLSSLFLFFRRHVNVLKPSRRENVRGATCAKRYAASGGHSTE